jgi:hypothetical protein
MSILKSGYKKLQTGYDFHEIKAISHPHNTMDSSMTRLDCSVNPIRVPKDH